MAANEIAEIEEAVNKFLSENEENLEIIKTFEEQLVYLTKDNFPETIQLIKDHPDAFFKDHSSVFTFFNIIIRSLVFNFLKLELILDIVITFSSEMRNAGITEYELLKICDLYQISTNYLFAHNFFTIEEITKYSYTNDLSFIKFLPEIEQYDPEYAMLRKKNFNFENNKRMEKLFECVINDHKLHIENRNLMYHPSPLHKSIRDDDIDKFQSLLSKKNINVNYCIDFSFYERAQTIDLDLSLIQIAATYSAIKVFKFLWMQNGIEPPENLLQYAFFGCNNEIIHLCENKLSHEKAILQTIFLNRFDLLDYYLENFGDKISEKDEVTKEALKKFDDSKSDDCEDLYRLLNSQELFQAINYFSVPIIQSCLSKIAFIVKNVDFEMEKAGDDRHFLIISSLIHFDLFKFLYTLKKSDSEKLQSECFICLVGQSISQYANESFKFLLVDMIGYINLYSVFRKCLNENIELMNFLLDFQLYEINSNSESTPIFDELKKSMSSYDLISIIDHSYNEDAVVKMIKLYDALFVDDKSINDFVDYLINVASKRMILSLFDRLYDVLSKEILLKIADAFKENKNFEIADSITAHLNI